MNKTSILISKELSNKISIFALLEQKKKEQFVELLLSKGIEQYSKKYEHHKFR